MVSRQNRPTRKIHLDAIRVHTKDTLEDSKEALHAGFLLKNDNWIQDHYLQYLQFLIARNIGTLDKIEVHEKLRGGMIYNTTNSIFDRSGSTRVMRAASNSCPGLMEAGTLPRTIPYKIIARDSIQSLCRFPVVVSKTMALEVRSGFRGS